MGDLLREYLDFAVDTAYLAGRLTLGYFQVGVDRQMKGDMTPVTEADRRAEVLIRERIESRYPHHGIVGEEFGEKATPTEGKHRWFVDPLDGTRSFICGVPLYAVLLGLEIDGEVRVGAAYYPALDEMLYAAIGEGCWCNGRRARVSQVSSMDQAVLTFTGPLGFLQRDKGSAWDALQRETGYAAGWTDAYGYLLAATGRTEIAVDPLMETWDCGPFPPIFHEAGGYFGDWQGNRTIYGGEALATNLSLLPKVLAILDRDDGD
jgi:myo-inositol-1(or 4)-monophosphatase